VDEVTQKPRHYVSAVIRNRRTWEVYSCGDLCLITLDLDSGQVLCEGSYGPYAHRFYTDDIVKFCSELTEKQYLMEKFVSYEESRGRNKSRRAEGFEWWFPNIWLQFVDYLKVEIAARPLKVSIPQIPTNLDKPQQ